MQKTIAFEDILAVFANYSFQKASMDDLAQAAGVSRQTLYNRFKTKQAVLDWAVTGFVEDRTGRLFTDLKQSDQSVATRLLHFYCEWMGQLVPVLHNTPHGSEIFEIGIESLEREGVSTHSEYEHAVAAFLVENDIYRDLSEASETAFLLTMGAKGILFKFNTVEEFEAGMKRIIRTALPDC